MKNKLRQEIAELRSRLTEEEVASMSNQIQFNISTIDCFKKSKSIFTYVSYKNEVSTISIIKQNISKHIITVPYITNTSKHEMEPSLITDIKDLTPKEYGILGPTHLSPYNLDNINIAIIPGVVFSRKGQRIGQGKGFYDKLLESRSIIKIGLAYSFQVLDSIPTDRHDVNMDYIVTEKEVIKIEN